MDNMKKYLVYGGSILGVIAFAITVGVFAPQGTISDGPSDSDGDQGPTLPGDSENMIAWGPGGDTIPLEVRAPVASDLEVAIIDSDLQEDDGGMKGDYGNYVDFSLSDVKSGWTQGVDYFSESVTGQKTVTFAKETITESGTYQAAVVDTATEAEYHDMFVNVEVPENVTERRLNSDDASQVIISVDEFQRMAAYDSDSASVAKVGGELSFSDLEGETNLAASAYDAEEETFEVTREVEYQHGVDLLGEVSLNTLSSNVTELEVTVESSDGDGVLYSEVIAEDGEKTDVDTEFGSDIENNPEEAQGDLVVTYTVSFEGGEVTADETLFTADILDIYGDSVGTAGATSLTA